MDRYTVISADGHGGGAIADYRPYLPASVHDRFDAWRVGFANPYDDLEGDDAARNWDSDRRLAELEAEGGLPGGVLLPGTPPGSGLPPLYAPDYEPLWQVCEDLGLTVNHHTGSASPDYGDYPEAKVMFLVEATWWAHRALWQLVYSGV